MNLEEKMIIDNICEIIREWYGSVLSNEDIANCAQDILDRDKKKSEYKKIKDIVDKYVCQAEDGETDGLIYEIIEFLEENKSNRLSVRDTVLSDFEYELENNNFADENANDASYQYMITQLDIHYRDKDPADESLTLHDCANILLILDDLEKYTLKEAYEAVIEFLEGEDYEAN